MKININGKYVLEGVKSDFNFNSDPLFVFKISLQRIEMQGCYHIMLSFGSIISILPKDYHRQTKMNVVQGSKVPGLLE